MKHNDGKIHVAFLLSRFLDGGIDTVLLEYLRGIDKSRFDVSLSVSMCYENLEVFRNFVPDGIKVEYLVKNHFLTKYRIQKYLGKISKPAKLFDETILNAVRRAIQRRRIAKLAQRCDVLVDFDSMHYSLVRGLDVKTVSFFHFAIGQYHRGNKKKIERMGKKFEAYDRIVLICNQMHEECEHLFPFLKPKLRMIYNPFDFEKIKQKSLAYKPNYDNYIVSVARINESQKDFTTLVKAYAQVAQQLGTAACPDLCIVGEGPDTENIKALTTELGVADKVHFVGFAQNPMPWIAAARLFVLSTKFEGFSVVLAEALSLDRVVIATNVPHGPAEILENGQSGLLAKLLDVNDLAQKIVIGLTDENLRQRVRENARKGLYRFESEHSVGQLEALCEELVGGAGRG